MNDRTIVVGCLLALVLVGALALATAPETAPDGDATTAPGTRSETGPTASPTATRPSRPTGTAVATTRPAPATSVRTATSVPDSPTETPQPFEFEIVRTEECGATCRDVTVELTNTRTTTVDDVAVATRVFAGNETTERRLIWTGREAVGTMAGGETVTSTRRVELGFGGALAVRNNGGWITIVTVVRSDRETVELERSERVA
jgi:hypothetical protein